MVADFSPVNRILQSPTFLIRDHLYTPLEFVHVKGSTHSVEDRLSHYPEKENTCLDLKDRIIPSVASKSLRTKQSGKNPTDSHINNIASIAKSDED